MPEKLDPRQTKNDEIHWRNLYGTPERPNHSSLSARRRTGKVRFYLTNFYHWVGLIKSRLRFCIEAEAPAKPVFFCRPPVAVCILESVDLTKAEFQNAPADERLAACKYALPVLSIDCRIDSGPTSQASSALVDLLATDPRLALHWQNHTFTNPSSQPLHSQPNHPTLCIL